MILKCIVARPRTHLAGTCGDRVMSRPAPLDFFAVGPANAVHQVEGVFGVPFRLVRVEVIFGDGVPNIFKGGVNLKVGWEIFQTLAEVHGPLAGNVV